MDRNGSLWIPVINNRSVGLNNEVEHSLEVCKLETSPASPLSHTCKHCASLAYHLWRQLRLFSYPAYVRSGSQLRNTTHNLGLLGRCHLPFYSPTVGTIALCLVCEIGIYRSYAVTIPALLSVIPTGVRNVPWVDWGPSSTHVLEIATLTPAGPFWIKSLVPLEVRRYDLRRTQHIRSMAENMTTLLWLLNSDTTEVIMNNFGTHMPYRDVRVPASDGDISCSTDIVADREWVVVVKHSDVSSVYTSSKHYDDSLITCADRER